MSLDQHLRTLVSIQLERLAIMRLTNTRLVLGIHHQVLSNFFFKGFIKANIAKRFADDPELTINAYFDPINLANFFQIFSLYFPLLFFENKTLEAFMISSFEKELGDNRYLFFRYR